MRQRITPQNRTGPSRRIPVDNKDHQQHKQQQLVQRQQQQQTQEEATPTKDAASTQDPLETDDIENVRAKASGGPAPLHQPQQHYRLHQPPIARSPTGPQATTRNNEPESTSSPEWGNTYEQKDSKRHSFQLTTTRRRAAAATKAASPLGEGGSRHFRPTPPPSAEDIRIFLDEDFGYDSPSTIMHRTPLIVPDSRYKAFLLSQSMKERQQYADPAYLSNTVNLKCCASCCTGFSFVGVCFLLFIAIIIDNQPLFIGGVVPEFVEEAVDNGKVTKLYYYDTSRITGGQNQRLPSASRAYQAAFAYFITFLVCIIYTNYDDIRSQVRRRNYQDIPDTDSTISTTTAFHNPNDANANNSASTNASTSSTPAYQISLMNKLVDMTSTGSVMFREMTSKWKYIRPGRKMTAKAN